MRNRQIEKHMAKKLLLCKGSADGSQERQVSEYDANLRLAADLEAF